METLSVKTSRHVEFVEITALVRRWVGQQHSASGVVTVYVPHTTAGIMINENADPDVIRDLTMQLDKIIPHDDGYHHAEGNAAAHIKATMVGSSVQIIVEQGQLALGTWQGIFFAEFDGPRRRKVHMTLTGTARG